MTSRSVLDASAVLAWLQQESGAEIVDSLLSDASISTVNWSEVLQKVAQRGRNAGDTGDLLRALGMDVIPLSVEDAAHAAGLWLQAPSLSLGDRCCLALAYRLAVPAVTADRSWLAVRIEVDVRTIR